MSLCPLCKGKESSCVAADARREYFRCRNCRLIFTDPATFLSFDDEKRRYDLHENSREDPDYRKFLSRLFLPMNALLAPASRGLDFGSGPGPALASMFEESGHNVAIYDSFYAVHPVVFEERYDFITATEVLEHLRDPGAELDRLWSRLNDGGLLGLMTKLTVSEDSFLKWHYINDPTHVCFFSRETFHWLGSQWGAAAVFPEPDVILFRKCSSAGFPA